MVIHSDKTVDKCWRISQIHHLCDGAAVNPYLNLYNECLSLSRSAAVPATSHTAGVCLLRPLHITLIGDYKTRNLIKWKKRKGAQRGVVNGMDLKVKWKLRELSTRCWRYGGIKTFKSAPVLLARSFGCRNITARSPTWVTVAGTNTATFT